MTEEVTEGLPKDSAERNQQYGRITSFSLRGKRLGDKYERLMEQYAQFYTIDVPKGFAPATIADTAVIDLCKEFGREAPLIIEVGPGSGEQLAHAAAQNPEINFLAFEAWGPGVARCVQNAVRAGVENVRILELDAAQALPIIFGAVSDDGVPLNPLAQEVWTFFPDPWRKKRHRKRRIISPAFAQIVAGVLVPGGLWRMATDWDNYAWQMRDVIEESPWFENDFAGENEDLADEGIYRGGFAPRFVGRLLTRFEERGIEAGRTVHDVVGTRNELASDAALAPMNPWEAAKLRGEIVAADAGGERPASSRRGWLKEQAALQNQTGLQDQAASRKQAEPQDLIVQESGNA
ncbi:MAG: tRNA (guanosine(46)-N7)-methyltransferase TrmB [Arcanobacterium sp.]|nr:tRNA (guanosine(46)-N7)-methyltransferase TrmB [Arcanobacterium sp.]